MFPSYWPHAICLLHDPPVMLFQILSDLLIALAYFAIPSALWYFTRHRRDVPFRGVVVWFGIFIIGCGCTHLANIMEVWLPWYWLSGSIKLATAIVSWITLAQLLPLIPQAIALPSISELDRLRLWLDQEKRKIAAELVMNLTGVIEALQHLAIRK